MSRRDLEDARECRGCGRELPVAQDQTDPCVDEDEVILDSAGLMEDVAPYYWCGRCLSAAGKNED